MIFTFLLVVTTHNGARALQPVSPQRSSYCQDFLTPLLTRCPLLFGATNCNSDSPVHIGHDKQRKGNDVHKHLATAITVTIAVTIALLAGCDNAKSPDSVATDVAAAQQKAANEVADAQKDASKEVDAAAAKVNDKSAELDNASAKGAYEIAMAKADGDHRVAVEQCKALSGDAQRKCKDVAEADYAANKADAKASEMAQKQ